MINSTLAAPLGRLKAAAKKSQNGLRTTAIAFTGLSLLVLATATAWIWLVDDPLGGQPTAQVALREELQSFADREIDLGDLRANDDGEYAVARATSDGGWSYEQGSNVVVGGPRIAGDGDLGSGLSFRPDPRLIEDHLMGNLPRVGDDGSRPMDVYSAPMRVAAVDSPKVALVIGGLGLSQTRSLEAIEALPSQITFAFSPYGASLDRWTMAARQKGHELLLQVPMEPFDYPDNDPGPHTLLVEADNLENTNRLNWLMSRITNYVGIINDGGSRFTALSEAMRPLASAIAERGLMMVDDGTSARATVRDEASRASLPHVTADAVIDDVPTPETIRSKLLQLEQLARSRGHAIGVAAAIPVTIKEVAAWAEELDKRGVYLVPVTAIEATLSGRLDG